MKLSKMSNEESAKRIPKLVNGVASTTFVSSIKVANGKKFQEVEKLCKLY